MRGGGRARVLAVGAHPDDVEVGVGGLVLKLVERGHEVRILDLTRGESATRGSVDERRRESEAAAEMLGVARRLNAELPDGAIANTQEQRLAVAKAVREVRPGLILAPMKNDRHPDHIAAHALVHDGNYLAGLASLDCAGEPHRAPLMYFYAVYRDDVIPDLVIDISAQFETKLKALEQYGSQFRNSSYEGRETYVSSEGFWELIRARAAYWGRRVGVQYGEPLFAQRPIRVDLPPGIEEKE